MEYLMTYGWAILIIAVVLGALFQLGVFNSSSFSPRAPPGACQVFRPSGPGTTTNINLMGVCTGQLPQYVAQFNGASSYVNVGSTSSLNPTATITTSAWINLNSPGVNYQTILTKRNSNTAKQYVLGTADTCSDVKRMMTFTISIGNTWVKSGCSQSLDYGKWYYAVGTYDGSYVSIYINGVLVNSASTTGAIDTTSEPLSIGLNRGYSIYFNGSISNVQIYNTSLTANQIQALYLEGIGGAPMKLQNLAGWWPLNGNSNDYSGNNNNGVPTNVVFTSQYGK